MTLRRRAFSLPYQDQVAHLAALLRGGGDGAPEAPDRFVAAAEHHNVAAYAVSAPGLPASLSRRLRDGHARRVLHAALLRRHLPEAIRLVAEACGCEPVLLKGPAVADRYYPDWRLRPFADLDLLVPRERLHAAVAAVTDAGWKPLVEFRPGYAELHGHDVHLVRQVGSRRLDVELHWRVGDDAAATALRYERVAGQVERIELQGTGQAATVAAAAEQLLVLALHLLSDRAKRLAWVHDIVLVSEGADDHEWRRVFELADELNLAWVLHRALDYGARYFELARPRPRAAGPAPPFGPLRAVEELNVRASPHIGRLAPLGWGARARYLRDVLVPTRAGLQGTVGGNGASTPGLLLRHVGRALTGVMPRGRS